MGIRKIVITGGPCAGKSKALKSIRSAFTEMGYTVITIAETATELIDGNISPKTCPSVYEFQKAQLKLQLEKERIYEEAAGIIDAPKTLIICDRGALDNKAYLSHEDFTKAIKSVNYTEEELQRRYDAVFYMVTTAKGNTEKYSTKNNTARTETAEEAALLDDKLIDVWSNHPYFRVIECYDSFEEKASKLIEEISVFLGEC